MNSFRLSTSGRKKGEIIQRLVSEVIKMNDVYIKGENGLRVKASDGTPVSNQLFYILAIGSDNSTLAFKNSGECAKYFGVTSATINSRIVKKQPFSVSKGNNIEYMFFT